MSSATLLDRDANTGVVLVSLFLTPCSSVSIVNFEYIRADWNLSTEN